MGLLLYFIHCFIYDLSPQWHHFPFYCFEMNLLMSMFSWFWLFSLNNLFLFNYSLVSIIFTIRQYKNPYLNQLLLLSPCSNTKSWSWNQICDTSFFLFILKFLWLVKLLMFYVIKFKFLKLMVSTSSVVWSQVRWFFILEYFHAINHGERIKSFRISSMFYCL